MSYHDGDPAAGAAGPKPGDHVTVTVSGVVAEVRAGQIAALRAIGSQRPTWMPCPSIAPEGITWHVLSGPADRVVVRPSRGGTARWVCRCGHGAGVARSVVAAWEAAAQHDCGVAS